MRSFHFLISIAIVLVIFSGCINPNTDEKHSITTKEFNLKVSEVEIYPRYVKEGMPFSLKFFLENKGTEDIKIWNIRITTESTCNIGKISYYPESYCIGKEKYIECTIPSGSTLIIKAEGQVKGRDVDGNCEGRLTYDYEDKSEILKYIAVVNEREIITAGKIDIKGAEIKSSSQLEIKISVDEPIIAKNEDNNDFIVNFLLKNKGDGIITIDTSQISLSRDSAFIFKGCSQYHQEGIITIQPLAEKILSCKFALSKIPSIREDYRLFLKIPYSVNFAKPFTILIQKEKSGFLKPVFYEVTGKSSWGTIHISLSNLKRTFKEGLTMETFFKEASKTIAKKIASAWLKKELDLMNVEFDIGVREYAKRYEGGKYGQYDGRIAARVRAEGLSNRIFEKNGCNKYKDLNIEEWIDCCWYIKNVSSCNELLKDDWIDECINERISLDKPKIERRIITPGIEKNRKQIEEAILKAVDKSVREDNFVLKKLYEETIEEKLREQIQIGGDLGGLRVTANLDDVANEIAEEFIVSITEEHVRSHTIPGIVEDFKTGYKEKFWETYEKEFRKLFPKYLYKECSHRIITGTTNSGIG